MDVTELIDGCGKLVAVYGYWPTFHDAEVLEIKLDRLRVPDGTRPTLDALIHTWEITNDLNADGCYVLRNHVLVHLRFREIVGLKLDGFNLQNVLWALDISEPTEATAEPCQFGVAFVSTYGVEASFHCGGIEVVDVTPCD